MNKAGVAEQRAAPQQREGAVSRGGAGAGEGVRPHCRSPPGVVRTGRTCARYGSVAGGLALIAGAAREAAQVASRARAKGRHAAAAAKLSFAAYVEALLLRDEVDENGCPRWAAPRAFSAPAAPRVRASPAAAANECERDVSESRLRVACQEVIAG